jgi:hypothetical protein
MHLCYTPDLVMTRRQAPNTSAGTGSEHLRRPLPSAAPGAEWAPMERIFSLQACAADGMRGDA